MTENQEVRRLAEGSCLVFKGLTHQGIWREGWSERWRLAELYYGFFATTCIRELEIRFEEGDILVAYWLAVRLTTVDFRQYR